MGAKPVMRCIVGTLALVSLACGGVVAGVGIWFGTAASWNFLSIALLSWGAAIVTLSIIGLLASCGADCGHCLLCMYCLPMLIVSLGNTVFVIVAGVNKDDWISNFANNVKGGQEDAQQVQQVENFYQDHWGLFVGFFAATAGSGLLGSVMGLMLFSISTRVAKYRGRADFETGGLPTSSPPGGTLNYTKKVGSPSSWARIFKRNGKDEDNKRFIASGAHSSTAAAPAPTPGLKKTNSVRLSKAIADGRNLQTEMGTVDATTAGNYYKERADEGKGPRLPKSLSLMRSRDRS